MTRLSREGVTVSLRHTGKREYKRFQSEKAPI